MNTMCGRCMKVSKTLLPVKHLRMRGGFADQRLCTTCAVRLLAEADRLNAAYVSRIDVVSLRRAWKAHQKKEASKGSVR